MKSRQIAPVVSKKSLMQSDHDVLYWRTQPYEARLAALEEIRQEYHRWKGELQPGIRRVVRIVHLSQEVEEQ